MKKVLLLITVLYAVSCTAPIRRQSDVNNISVKNSSKQSGQNQTNAPVQKSDTTIIYLSKQNKPNANQKSNLNDFYANALNKFNNNDYQNAAKQFKEFIEESTDKNSKYYQAMFMYAECMRQENSTPIAIDIMNQYVNDKNVPADVLQPTLVLLGQCYCDVSQNKKANEAFARLKREFPTSDYIKIAHCN